MKAAGIDPLLHFEQFGYKEGGDRSLLFSDSNDLAAYPDVAAAGVNPLLHHIQSGQHEERSTLLTDGTATADPLVQAAYVDPQLGATLPSGTAGRSRRPMRMTTAGGRRV